jgi:hypothetical protein
LIIGSEEDLEEVLAKNRSTLRHYAQLFLDRIADPKLTEEMPREIRAIAGYTATNAKTYAPEQILPLVGGFLMLRYFCPSMVTPEYWGILSSDINLTPEARRNLVLLTKLLQV